MVLTSKINLEIKYLFSFSPTSAVDFVIISVSTTAPVCLSTCTKKILSFFLKAKKEITPHKPKITIRLKTRSLFFIEFSFANSNNVSALDSNNVFSFFIEI